MCVAALACMSQPRFTSNTERHSLGQIVWKHPVNVQYTVTNTGDRPLVLTSVEPDCACTVAQWTQAPIPPGQKGEINVTFDAEALGHFQKSIAILTNTEPHLVYLYFDGEVVQTLSDFTRSHPYLIGNIRIDRNTLEFPDAHIGDHPTLKLDIVNLSDQAYEPVLMHLPPYIGMEANPSMLQKGERGTLTLTLHSERLTDVGLTQASVYLSRFPGDKVGEENEIPLSAILLPDFSDLTENERLNAPHIQLESTKLHLLETLSKKRKAKQSVEITNTGHSPLHIIKLQVFHPAVSVQLKKSVLKPGESTRLKISVHKKRIRHIRRHLRLLMITNDPDRPKVVIDL